MSDYFDSRKKLVQGNEWRGTITVNIDDNEYEWTARQLKDDEYFDVINDIDRESIQQFRDEVDEDKLEEFRELQDKDERTDEEEERYEELRDEIEDSNILDRIDDETFNAVRRAGMYGVVPSDDDLDEVMNMTFDRQTDIFKGIVDKVPEIYDEDSRKVVIQSRDDARKAVKEDMKERLRNATNFVSFEVGMQVLSVTMDTEESEGN